MRMGATRSLSVSESLPLSPDSVSSSCTQAVLSPQAVTSVLKGLLCELSHKHVIESHAAYDATKSTSWFVCPALMFITPSSASLSACVIATYPACMCTKWDSLMPCQQSILGCPGKIAWPLICKRAFLNGVVGVQVPSGHKAGRQTPQVSRQHRQGRLQAQLGRHPPLSSMGLITLTPLAPQPKSSSCSRRVLSSSKRSVCLHTQLPNALHRTGIIEHNHQKACSAV